MVSSTDGEHQPLLLYKTVNSSETDVTNTDSGLLEAKLPGTTKNQLGTINGCFVPCLLNIMGIILFLRLGWVVGQVGILAALIMLSVATLQAVITVLSLSALVTNGMVSTGGSYYMISRCLGPEFGGAIGLLFYCAYAMGVAFYTIGFATTVQGTFFADVPHPAWTIRLVGSIALLFVLSISLMGAEFFSRFNVLFFAIQFGSIAIGMISFLIPRQFSAYFANGTAFNTSTSFPSHISHNLSPNLTTNPSCIGKCDFHQIFAIMFPMVTGIMEGANLSGDLKNPGHSIPLGTLSALATAFSIYVFQIVFMGGAFNRHTLIYDKNIFQDACVGSKFIVVVGILISSLSSALGSLFGGSRVLQAMSRDNLMGALKPFKFGSKHGDEPRIAVCFTWLIAQACVMIGDLDVVAPIETSFFCLSYAIVNLTCFILSAMGAPNFRPRFKYYSWPVALFGATLNIVIMFFLNWMYATVTIACMFLLYVYLSFNGPVTDWGDITNELIYHQVRKYLLRLSTSPSHSKFWKPNLLVIPGGCDAGLLAFCNSLKKGGLMVIGQVLVGPRPSLHRISIQLRLAWNAFVKRHRLKAFVHTTTSEDVNLAYRILMDTSGLGGLIINTGKTIHPIGPETYHTLASHLEREYTEIVPAMSVNLPCDTAMEYCRLLRDILAFEKNCIISRNFMDGLLGKRKRIYTHTSDRPNIDVWIFGSWTVNEGQRIWNELDLNLPDPSIVSLPEDLVVENDEIPQQNHGSFDTPGPICFTGLVALLVQLGHIFRNSRIGAGGLRRQKSTHRLRIFHLANIDASSATEANHEALLAEEQLQDFCNQGRVDIDHDDIKIFTLHDLKTLVPDYGLHLKREHSNVVQKLERLPSMLQAKILNSLISLHSANTCQLFIPLPMPPRNLSLPAADAYVRILEVLSAKLPPVAMVASGETTSYISTSI